MYMILAGNDSPVVTAKRQEGERPPYMLQKQSEYAYGEFSTHKVKTKGYAFLLYLRL